MSGAFDEGDREAIVAHLLDHFEHPRNRGPLPGADVSQKGGNPGCGDILHIHLKVEDGGGAGGGAGNEPGAERIAAIRFEGEGCTISQASASILTEIVGGKPLDEVLAMASGDLVDALGREVVVARLKCAVLSLNTLKAAIEKYRQMKTRRALGLDEPGMPEPSGPPWT